MDQVALSFSSGHDKPLIPTIKLLGRLYYNQPITIIIYGLFSVTCKHVSNKWIAWVDGDLNIQSLKEENFKGNILLSCTNICH